MLLDEIATIKSACMIAFSISNLFYAPLIAHTIHSYVEKLEISALLKSSSQHKLYLTNECYVAIT